MTFIKSRTPIKLGFICLSVALGSSTAVAAQPEGERVASSVIQPPDPATRSAQRESATDSPVKADEEDRLTGDWGGARSKLTERGLNFSFVYKLEHNETLSGGLNQGSKTLGNFDARAALDLEKIAGWHGASAFIYGLGDHGGDPSKNVGDNQVTSNIETPVDTFRLYEAWFQQLAFEDKVSFLIGLHDLNSEFYTTDTSGLFFNSSFGVGRDLSQTGANGPSIFPVTAPAFRVRVEPTKSFYMQTAVFNGVAGLKDTPHGTHARISPDDGLLQIAEAGINRPKDEAHHELPVKYAIGLWSYSIPVAEIKDASKSRTNNGFYLLADHSVTDNAAVFLRAGWANQEVNTVASNVSTGFVMRGLIPARPSDRTGIAVTSVRFSDAYRQTQEAAGTLMAANETTVELNHRCELGHGLTIQPDLQYVDKPSGSEKIPAATVFATRFEFNF